MDSPSPREQLFDIFADTTKDTEAKIQTAIEAGAEYLGLSIGFLTEIDQGTQRIVQATGDHPAIQPGGSCPLEEAYCRRTVEIDTPLAVQNATGSEAISEAAIRAFNLGAYIGAKVVVDDETYGTVCFADYDERDEEFSPGETHFVELLANLCGNALERRAYERELAEREEIYRAVIDSSFDLVFRVGTDGKFTFVSAAIEEFLGYAPEEYIGQPFTRMLPDEKTIDLANTMYEEVLAGHTVEEEYFPLESESGRPVFVDLRVTPIYRSGGSQADHTSEDVVGLQGTAHEATGRLQRERLIRVLNRVLRHNLRNDMNVVSGFADILAEELTGDNARLAERIIETTDSLLDLTESARKLEENLDSPPDVQEIDLVPIVQRVAEQTARRYPNATIDVEVPDAAVARSAPRVETAIWELLDNAAKHTGDNPTVEVHTTTTDERVVIRIADDGPGLPDIERSVLATGEETPITHGKGLGLWLVYWIVETLKGELSVLDADCGTHIEIQLPAGGQPEETGHATDGT